MAQLKLSRFNKCEDLSVGVIPIVARVKGMNDLTTASRVEIHVQATDETEERSTMTTGTVPSVVEVVDSRTVKIALPTSVFGVNSTDGWQDTQSFNLTLRAYFDTPPSDVCQETPIGMITFYDPLETP